MSKHPVNVIDILLWESEWKLINHQDMKTVKNLL